MKQKIFEQEFQSLGRPLTVSNHTLCELGDGLSATGFMVDWHGDGSRDILYSLLPNMHNAGVYLYRERKETRQARIPIYEPPVPLLNVTGYHAIPLETANGGLNLLTYGNATRDSKLEHDVGWLKLYSNHATRSCPSFGNPATRIPVAGQKFSEVFSKADLWNINPYSSNNCTHLVVSCLYDYVVEYWPDSRGTDLREYPYMGAGRGYCPKGKWMGQKPTTRVFILRNQGTNETPKFGPPELLLEYKSWDGRTDANIIDVDRDGNLELLIRRDVDRLFAVRLTPTVQEGEQLPRLKTTGTLLQLPCSPLRRGYFETSLCYCDVDADGENEILITGNPGVIFWLKYTAGAWKEQEPLKRTGGSVRVETLAVPCLAALKHNTKPDLIVGDSSGYLWWFENQSIQSTDFEFGAGIRLESDGVQIHHTAGPTGSIQGPNEARWGYLNPLVVDWDHDGLCDMITNDITGSYLWYRNVSTEKKPHYARPVKLYINGIPLTGAWRSRPASWGNKKLVLLNWDGILQIFKQSDSNPCNLEAGPLLRYTDGNLIRGCGPGGLWGRTAYCSCDWDLDGTRDIVAGSVWANSRVINGHFPALATPFWLHNVGTDEEPVFERPRLITERNGNPINLVSHKCAPWCVDIDGDGDPDLLCGSEDGKIYAWQRHHLRWDWDPATRFTTELLTTTSGNGMVITVNPDERN